MEVNHKKYYEYIINELDRNTHIKDDFLYFPFDVSVRIDTIFLLPLDNINEFVPIGFPHVITEWMKRFFKYIERVYGLNLEEMEYVYSSYIRRIFHKIAR